MVPALYIQFAARVLALTFSPQAFEKSQWLAIEYVTVFFIAYLISKDHIIQFTENLPGKMSRQIALIVYMLIPVILLFIITFFVPKVFALKHDRGTALMMYEKTIDGPFKLTILLYLHVAATFILFWKKKKLALLLPLLLYWIIDFSHGGRTMTLMTLIFGYILVVLKTEKTYFKYFLILILLMVVAGLVQRTTDSGWLWYLYMSGVEFSNTRMTTVYLFDHPEVHGDIVVYFANAVSKIFPGGFFAKLIDFGDWYGEYLAKKIGLGYGLAGNLMSEALFYGGVPFAVASPFIIGGFLLLLNRMKWHTKIIGLTYILILIVSMQNIVRTYFYGFMFYPLEIILFALFPALSDLKKNIFYFNTSQIPEKKIIPDSGNLEILRISINQVKQ
jgi:hypothetical protein